FRLDFIAFCLFGIFLCIVIRSGVFHSWRWSLAAGAAGAYLLLFRHWTAVFLAGIMGSVLVWFCLERLLGRGLDARVRAARRLRGALFAAVVIGSAGSLVVLSSWQRLRHYYLETGVRAEGAIRSQDSGVTSGMSQMRYYFRHLLIGHTGW